MDKIGTRKFDPAIVDAVEDDRGDHENGTEDDSGDGGAVEDIREACSSGRKTAGCAEHE